MSKFLGWKFVFHKSASYVILRITSQKFWIVQAYRPDKQGLFGYVELCYSVVPLWLLRRLIR